MAKHDISNLINSIFFNINNFFGKTSTTGNAIKIDNKISKYSHSQTTWAVACDFYFVTLQVCKYINSSSIVSPILARCGLVISHF